MNILPFYYKGSAKEKMIELSKKLNVPYATISMMYNSVYGSCSNYNPNVIFDSIK